MNFEEFKQQIMEDLPGALPERLSSVEIEPVSVTKLQHGSYDGITIREEGSNIGMNLDLTRLYDRMETGTAYDDVLAEAVAVISNATAQAPNIDVDRLMDYEQLRETLSIQVVPTASNAEMLENIPHKEMEDLSMVYRFVVGQDENGTQTILVTNMDRTDLNNERAETRRHVSIDEEDPEGVIFASGDCVEQLVEDKELMMLFYKTLVGNERYVFLGRFNDDLTMDEVAKELHLTKGRVCQIEKVIMRKLKMFFETH